jgi:DMSO reductase anchor subunit
MGREPIVGPPESVFRRTAWHIAPADKNVPAAISEVLGVPSFGLIPCIRHLMWPGRAFRAFSGEKSSPTSGDSLPQKDILEGA